MRTDRMNAMEQYILKNGSVSLDNLVNTFHVSMNTVRRDIASLLERGNVRKVYGGVCAIPKVSPEPVAPISIRASENSSEKEIIGRRAANLVKDHSSIFLDSGSTTTAFARQIPDRSYLIYTTGLSCATELANLSKPTVMLPGGKLNRYSQSVFGYSAIRELERVNFDQAFLGVTGFHPSVGFSCGISDEALLKETAIRQSGQVIALMDSSKIDVKCSFSFCRLSDIDVVVSDGKLPEEFLDECRKFGVQVL